MGNLFVPCTKLAKAMKWDALQASSRNGVLAMSRHCCHIPMYEKTAEKIEQGNVNTPIEADIESDL